MNRIVTVLIAAMTICTIRAGQDTYSLVLRGIDTTRYAVAEAGQIMTADIQGYEADIDFSKKYNRAEITCPLRDGKITIAVEKE